MGCRLWGCTESDTTEATQQQQHLDELARWSVLTVGLGGSVVSGASQSPPEALEFLSVVLIWSS